MQIIKVEIPEDSGVGICENCHASKPVRPVEAVGFSQESRGWYKICFDCFAPQMWWRDGKGGQVWVTPASNNRVHADAGESAVSTSSLQASADTTSQTVTKRTQRG